MRPLQYDPSFSMIALTILVFVWIHDSTQGKLNDYNNRLFWKLLLLSILDVFVDLMTTIIPAIGVLHMPVLYTAINAFYNQLNVYMCYNIFYYTNSLRASGRSVPKYVERLMMIPGVLSAVLLIANFPTKIVFYFDEEGVYHSGVLGQFVYYLAAFYILAAVILILVRRQEYGSRRMGFLFSMFGVLGICIMLQFFMPRMLGIDLGIALSILSFYLHISNPMQFVDKMTGALDRNYFDAWISDQTKKKEKVFLIALCVKNMNHINTVRGSHTGSELMAYLARIMRTFDHEKMVFRLSVNSLIIHCHNQKAYQNDLDRFEMWLRDEGEEIYEKYGCQIRILGIPSAEVFAAEYSVNSYIDFMLSRLNTEYDGIRIESTHETIAGFRYEKEIERFLKEALEQDMFTIAYQPIYDVKKQRYVSVEALSRLSHPVFGNLNPQKFIAIAERNDLIDELTRLQIRKMCSFMKSHPELTSKFDCFKFNLSPLNLVDHHFIIELIDIIQSYDVPCSKIEFEITESFATENNEELNWITEICRKHGIGLCLDDFGSGYSNLSSVLQIPFKSIKLDRSLLLEVSKNVRFAEFYAGIVHIMQNYGMDIICEGVETEEENNLIQRWGAEMIQGYYYSKPLPEDQLLKLLAA